MDPQLVGCMEFLSSQPIAMVILSTRLQMVWGYSALGAAGI
jgi:hypothetical protein